MHMFVGWRIIGWDTNYSATPITPIRSCTSPNFGTPNWVSVFAPAFGSMHLWVWRVAFVCIGMHTPCAGFESPRNGSVAQVYLYGDVIFTGLFPPTMRSALAACDYYLLLRCTASGSWRRIAPTFVLLCSGSTPNRSWNHTNWVAHFCSCLGMMRLVFRACLGTRSPFNLPTHSKP